MLKNILLRVTLITLFLLSLSIPYIVIKPIYIIPNKDNHNGYSSSDIEYGGRSVSELIEHSNTNIIYKSHLKDTYKYPYAGYTLSFKKDGLNFKYRNRIKYKITATESEFLRFNLGIKVIGKDNFIYQCDIKTSNEKIYREIPLNYLTPADWWYAGYNLSEDDFPAPELKNIVLFSIVNSSESPINKQETIEISEIKILLNPLPYILLSISALLALAFIELFPKLRAKKINTIYKEVQINPEVDPEEDIVIKYIGENYNKSDINVDTISEKTGVSKYKIPKIIKDRFDLTFPGYLNEIRMNEIKRLLIETNLPVLDLSLNVGYNTVSHFNRTFKKREGISPLNYRKKYQKNKKIKKDQ